ncbi:TRAP-type mannitol/chloroaromatic compound transport system%2C periplasmic component [uncultured Roseburia sp.]|uniref:TRAP transporter substrate-binding protein n=1 Tax=Brotonthovivens ammoniilytica TaxID=2981725 RepID=A0ABT2TLV4_9FIRM|nr:TRAP transporter substrate-binding protein [Brotonthovivens ammoniilytica]MCU6763194.1 TRAP transporter substrate-binding protein [Brotonthovivens ammoniilytica]SCJ06341.1 TRAP-type mannitol/chloroaromatic compound transport system%2C periplasmic component [uncultured Roseburia sp.]
MRKRIISILAAGCLCGGLLAGCGSSDSQNTSSENENRKDVSGKDFGEYSPEKPLELKLSHFAASEENQLAILANTFAEYVEEESGGSVKVTVYGGGTLGNDQESLDSVIAGTLDCAVNNTPIMSGYAQGLSVLDLPYLFEDYDDIYSFLDSEICAGMLEDFSSTGAKILGLQCVGFRNLESSKGFAETPEDLKGLKIRVTGSDVYINTWNTWGASAQTMPGNEVLTALQQGTIDGCDNVNNVCIADGYQQYAEYISVMEYAAHFNGITMNAAKFDSLTPDLQEVITSAAKKANLECTKNLESKNEEQLEEMVAGGAQKSENVDKEAFKKASQSVYEDFLKENEKGAQYYESIIELLGK